MPVIDMPDTPYTQSDRDHHVYMKSRSGYNALTFEIYYSDGTKVTGKNKGQWVSAPDDDVQVVVWGYNDGSMEMHWGMDTYHWEGTAEKTGKWMGDADFKTLRNSVPSTSIIYNP